MKKMTSGRYAPEVMVICAFLAISLPVAAQQRHTIETRGEGQTSRYIQQHAIDVDHAPGHQVRVLEVQRTYSDASKLRVLGKRVVESRIIGNSDYVHGSGHVRGYATWTLEDGERIFLEFDGVSISEITASGSMKGENHSTSRIVGGTGKYKGIRGLLRDVAQYDTDPQRGYSQGQTKGEYWFID